MDMVETRIVELRNAGGKKKELSPEEKSFFDLVLDGMSQVDAMFESGLFPKELSEDPKARKDASQKANYLLNTKRGSLYVMQNRKTAVIYTENDLPALMTHIYDIAMGNATTTMIIDGKEVTVSPSFRDQVSAATLFKSYAKDLKSEVRNIPLKSKKKAVDAIAIEFASKYQTRDVDDGFKGGRVTSPARINNDAFADVNHIEVTAEEVADEGPACDIGQL